MNASHAKLVSCHVDNVNLGLQPPSGDLLRIETFKFTTDLEAEAKIRDVVGLYLNPPTNAVVLSLDEKTQIQASYVFTRQAGSDTSVSITTIVGGAFIAAYRNASGIGAVGAFGEATGATLAPPSITPQNAGGLVLGIIGEGMSRNLLNA